jgi:hypothetical protein
VTQTLAWLAIVAGVALLTAVMTLLAIRPRELSLPEIQELKRSLEQTETQAERPVARLLPSP